MQNNHEWVDQTIDEILNGDQSSIKAWSYENGCSPLMEPSMLFTIQVLFQKPFKEQIKNALLNVTSKNSDDEKIHQMIEQYWDNFISSLNLPTTERVEWENDEQFNNIKDESLCRVLSWLKYFDIESDLLEQAIQTDISEPELRELVNTLIVGFHFLVNDSTTDEEMHNTFLAVLNRLKQLKSIGNISYVLAEYIRSEGYKLDEAVAINSLLLTLRNDEDFLKLFFKIKGDQLLPMLTNVFKVLGSQFEIEQP
ncbi:MAG: hypothetical protein JW712_04535 [Dehalococcoidales bacterium]|nr:hypothetical protein [Dehalococcoidales bacterium]